MARGFKTGGRTKGTPNKATAEFRKYAQQFDKESIDNLRVLAKTAEYDLARVMASKAILEFGHGKPPQAITGPDGEAIEVPQAIAFVIKKAEGSDRRA